MNYLRRRIFKNQMTGVSTLRELLQTMFVAEMLHTGGTLWIVSPWVSNVVLIDNRSGNFDSLNPEWGRREVRLAELLTALMARGSRIVLVTRDIETNKSLVNSLRDETIRQALEGHLVVVLRNELHTKGIVFSRSMLIGSMNLTYNGLEINDESIEFCIELEDIARTRLELGIYLEELR